MRKIKLILSGFGAVCVVTLLAAAGNSDFRLGKNIEILVNMMRDVSLFYVDEIDPDTLLENAAAGMMAGLDPYTEFISAEEMEEFEVMTTGKYGGIGSLIRRKGDFVVISQPYRNSPADKAGLRAGDKIIEINGTPAVGMETAEVSALLKGDPGTVVRLRVEKFTDSRLEDIQIRRERIEIPGVPYYGFVSDNVGYILHNDFTDNSSNEVLTALMNMKETGDLQALILDYRGNGGGILTEAVKVLSLFVPKGTEVVSMKGKTMDTPVVFKTENEPVDTEIPIVVLVSSGSASAAEIVAGALQDMDRAVLLGQRTFGKGLVQATRPLGYNSYLKITTAKYYIPSGRCIQAVDYARRNDDGSVAHVPDSLVREFHTRAGRPVYDGGGVMPDIETGAEYLSRYALTLYGLGYIDDYADQWLRGREYPESYVGFKLSDADYADFAEFMQGKEVEFESETSLTLDMLKIRAEREMPDTGVMADIEALREKVAELNRNNITLYREQITDIIEGAIISRLFYSDGVTAYKLPEDKDVQRAVELLSDRDRYESILSPGQE